ncbi:hypothetical protein C2845_PM04G29620 [Panicum miliaceum]|uniref:RNA helicase n=1 Tax=Panicum miliaceum TaxID=4540 RepID=A0A3L6QUR4_PANMI|nr:hypothetical protein C2845_PM04G29620 [Panicum miliaceum]
MAAQEAAAASADVSGPRFAPDDPTLPAPWKGLIDGATLYYWNPETNVTQYEKPAAAAAAPPLPAGPPPATPAQVPEPAPGASQPGLQFGQVGQATHQERPGQAVYPQPAQLGHQQQTQQPAQQQQFQHVPQHQASFQQTLQLPQVSQSQGLQMPSQQGQLQHGLQFSQHGKQPLSHGQQSPLLKDDDAGGHEGKRTGFSLPLSQQRGQAPLSNQQLISSHQYPGAVNQPNIPGVGGPLYPAKHLHGGSSPAETNNMGLMNSPGQMHQGAVPNHIGPSPVRPPMGFEMGNRDGHFERDDPHPYGRFDGANTLQQQPKLAAVPPSQTPLQGMRNGPPYPQADNFGGYNMAPPHSVPNPHNHGPLPIGASMRPPSRMFGPPDFPGISSADAYRQHHEVTAMGENVPAPFMTFEAAGFPPEILSEIHAAGFSNPTPIQAQTWPVALQNRDIVAIAKTGSGKTLGYLIPAFIHLRRCHNNPMLGPTVLVLAPTRELASQIQDEIVKFGRSSRVSCICLYGGASKGPQLRELERGADIVVATPGRLNDILEMKKISLHQVSLLVLDEADRMLDMGFEPQIQKIVDEIPRTRQTLMYTATWPKEVTKIAGDLLRDPVQVNIGSIDELVANKSITQYVEVIPPMDKQRRLEQILRDQERGSKIIIFCSTKKMCDQLARGIGRSFNAVSIHGDKSQTERDNVLNQFRTGRAPILVATDVAARGLDIKDIRVVINYDFPTGIEDYVHRIGRTGRAGATGVSYTFFSEQDWKYAGDLVKLLEGANQHVPPQLLDMAARGATGGLRNQAAGMSRWDGPGGGRIEPGVVDLAGGDVLTEVHMTGTSQMDGEATGAAGPVPVPVSGQAVSPVPSLAHTQSLTDTSAMSPMSPGGLVQPAAAPLNSMNDGNFSGPQAGQPFHGTDAAIPSFPAAETFPGSAVQQAAPDV